MSLGFVVPNLSDSTLTARPYNYWGKAATVLIRYTNGNSFDTPPIHSYGGNFQTTVKTERTSPPYIPSVQKRKGEIPEILSTITSSFWNFARRRFKRTRECRNSLEQKTYTNRTFFSSFCLCADFANRGTAKADSTATAEN